MTQITQPIPEGYHSLTPTLTLKDAAKTMEFYKKAFGAEERKRMEAPGTGKIMHAELKIGDSIFMIGDEMPEQGCLAPVTQGKNPPGGLYLYVKDADAVYQQAVDAGAQVKMPIADMFWGDRCGQVIDPSGHVWFIATHKEDLSSDQIFQRSQEFFKKQAGAK